MKNTKSRLFTTHGTFFFTHMCEHVLYIIYIYDTLYITCTYIYIIYLFIYLLLLAALRLVAALLSRTARDFVADLGTEKASSSKGLVELSRIDEHNAERDCRNLLAKKLKLPLPIPMTPLGTEGPTKKIPVLKLRDWCAYLLKSNNWHILTGLRRPDHRREEKILEFFLGPIPKIEP